MRAPATDSVVHRPTLQFSHMGAKTERNHQRIRSTTSQAVRTLPLWRPARRNVARSPSLWLSQQAAPMQAACRSRTEVRQSLQNGSGLGNAEQEAKDLRPSAEHPVHALRTKGSAHKKTPTCSKTENCYRCGGKYAADACKFKTDTCNYCHKQGHIASVCFKKARDSKKKPHTTKTHQLLADEECLVPSTRCTTRAPYHPATNSLAERAVQTFQSSSRNPPRIHFKLTFLVSSCSTELLLIPPLVSPQPSCC